MLLLLEIIVKV